MYLDAVICANISGLRKHCKKKKLHGRWTLEKDAKEVKGAATCLCFSSEINFSNSLSPISTQEKWNTEQNNALSKLESDLKGHIGAHWKGQLIPSSSPISLSKANRQTERETTQWSGRVWEILAGLLSTLRQVHTGADGPWSWVLQSQATSVELPEAQHGWLFLNFLLDLDFNEPLKMHDLVEYMELNVGEE